MIYKGKVSKIELFDNSALGLTMDTVKARTGCDIILNGGYFGGALQPYGNIRIDGKWIHREGWDIEGFTWDAGELPAMTMTRNSPKDNVYSCLPVIVDGLPRVVNDNAYDVGGRRGRSGWGVTGSGDWAFLCTSDALLPMTLSGARDELLAQGCVSAVLNDGGASSQGIFPGGTVTGGRKVSNFICVWIEKENKPEDGGDDMVKIDYQPTTRSDVWASTRTIAPGGFILHSPACPGWYAQLIRDSFNVPKRGASIHAVVDDKTIIQCLPWQKRAGHVGSGKYGSYNNSHIGVEMCEPTGLTYNANYSTIVGYNPPAGYFAKVWKNTVDLFAMLCKQYGLNPLKDGVILSHAEAHARGYGDNHADTAHWFKWENKTMDDFRKAVAEAMNEKPVKPGLGNSGEWSTEACQWAVDNGFFVGDGNGNFNWTDPMTREAMAAVLHRYHKKFGNKEGN